MKNIQLRAYRTLVRIRIRRQEALDQERIDARHVLQHLVGVVEEKLQKVEDSRERVTDQVSLIDDLLKSGRQFQIADYLAQQDYLASLEEVVKAGMIAYEEAVAQVAAQEQVVEDARIAANANADRRKTLEDRIRKILVEIDVRHMDNEDEEAEEAVVTRKLMKKIAAVQEATTGEHG